MQILRPFPLAPVAALSVRTERHLLQGAIALTGFAPVLAGLAGALLGSAMSGEGVEAAVLDGQVRALSGVLLAVGLAYWEAIPRIERSGERIRLLTALVSLGGLMRLVGMVLAGTQWFPMLLAVGLELAVAPAICLWQARVARRCGIRV